MNKLISFVCYCDFKFINSISRNISSAKYFAGTISLNNEDEIYFRKGSNYDMIDPSNPSFCNVRGINFKSASQPSPRLNRSQQKC